MVGHVRPSNEGGSSGTRIRLTSRLPLHQFPRAEALIGTVPVGYSVLAAHPAQEDIPALSAGWEIHQRLANFAQDNASPGELL